ncbi:MAG: lipid-A-disaccharide synthase [Robiginitomaculum sp.]|nr:MAG: lipid-A-disaccharide synthase [Robiginitomaculum sp.]
MTLHVYIVAAEKSGDELGAKLVKALRIKAGKNIEISGIGGSAMKAQGLISPIDIAPLSILGFLEGLKSYLIIMQLVKETTDIILASGADACVLIDSWGFMMRVAQRLKKHGYKGKIIKYVAPQVWAMREGRSKILAQGVDHLLTIHSFDAPYFTRHGLEVSYVGNPVFDEAYDTGDADALRREYNISQTTPVLALLFGSRLSEIQTLAAPFAEAVRLLKLAMPELVIVSPVSDTIATDVMAAAAEHPDLQNVILLNEERKLDCFALADVSISCSGTVTTQLASAGVPSIVGYRLNWLTYQIASRLFKPDNISIVNIAAEKALMPEFIQDNCTGENLANAALLYLQNIETRQTNSSALLQAVDAMRLGNSEGRGNEGAKNMAAHSSERAANAILDLLG